MDAHKKRLIKQGASAVCFCLLLILLIKHVYGIFSWKDSAGAYITSVPTFYELEKDMVDVLFLGSSHCYCSISSAQLWDDYGMAAYSLAISGQDLVSSYYWLKEALKTQSPKVVCLEMYGVIFHGYGVKGNLYRNLLPYRISGDYAHMLRDITGGEEGKELFTKWPILHTRYTELQKQDFSGELPLYIDYKADFRVEGIDGHANGLNAYTGGEVLAIDESEAVWLQKIIELARENNIELCFFASPFAATDEEQMKFNRVQQIADAEGIPFINTIADYEKLGLASNTDFFDWGHTNVWGAQKVTAYVGEFLAGNYELPDRRGDRKYGIWDRNSVIRTHELQDYQLQQMTDLQSVLAFAADCTDYTVLIATSGEYLREDVYLEDKLESLGICDAFYESGGTWVIADGELLLENFNWYGDMNGADLILAGDNNSKFMWVNQVDCIRVENGINITLYDNLTGTIIAMGFDALNGYDCVR